jgi:hypothetical protein
MSARYRVKLTASACPTLAPETNPHHNSNAE